MKKIRLIFRLMYQINWVKTVYLNFKMLPLSQAKHLPIVIFGRCKLVDLSGNLVLEGTSKFGRVGIGQKYQLFKVQRGVYEMHIAGTLTFKGRFQFGIDSSLFVGKNAHCILGDMASLGANSELICTKKVVFGDFCRIGTQAYISDSNFHQMKDTITNVLSPKNNEIHLGSHNFISTRVTILGKTRTPSFCTIASNTLLTKDYLSEGVEILLAGIPAVVVRRNVRRDWEGEKEGLEKFLKII